ncbi:hypothetical protein KI688_004665 [Linnemannia hyalina]|uniref:Uncharacterized protein n=1 Tax=Linnemannia hyalina TaxID=64524 RepID=A0A9P7XKQ2_9FUNG|nr:hypothetical protein KI688_004665 [Linnemannia hyalina]
MRSLSWYHPTVSLEIGTVSANANRVVVVNGEIPKNLADTAALTDVQREVIEYMQEAPRLAADVKRKAQRLIDHLIETPHNRMDKAEEDLRFDLESMNPPQTMSEKCRLQARKDAVSEVELDILLLFCEQAKPKNAEEDKGDAGGNKEEDDNSDLGDTSNKQSHLLLYFLTYLYSGNYPKTASKGGAVANDLIDWLVKREVYDSVRSRTDMGVTMPFTPGYLIHSVTGQLATEMKRLYDRGSLELQDKDYRERFQPQSCDRYRPATPHLFQEAAIISFSHTQVEAYVEQFVQETEVQELFDGQAIWNAKEYLEKLKTIKDLMELVKKPFMLSVALRAMPAVIEDITDTSKIKMTRLFPMDAGSMDVLEELLDDGFSNAVVDFLKDVMWRSPYFTNRTETYSCRLLFLAELAQANLDFKERLFQFIEQSKVDEKASQAAANAITILAKAGVSFYRKDLRGIRIPGADLSRGKLDLTQLQGVDFTGCNLSYIWLRHADLNGAHLAEVHLEHQPDR